MIKGISPLTIPGYRKEQDMDKNDLRARMESVLQAFDNYCRAPGEEETGKFYAAVNDVLALADNEEPAMAVVPKTENTKAEIAISGSLKLVAEVNPDTAGYKEIFIGLEEDGVPVQDLAMIGQKYHYDKGDLSVKNEPDKFRVLVWGDPEAEDYTEEFEIDKKGASPEREIWKKPEKKTQKSR